MSTRDTGRGPSDHLALADNVTVGQVTPSERRRAAVSVAAAAIAGDWVSELGDVLDTLGLRDEVPA